MPMLLTLEIFSYTVYSCQTCKIVKGSTSRFKYSAINLISGLSATSTGLGFLVYFFARKYILETRRGWKMCLPFKWLPWQATLFLYFLFNV